jgi:hypothetical protein
VSAFDPKRTIERGDDFMKMGGLNSYVRKRRRFALSSIFRTGCVRFILVIFAGLVTANAFASSYEDDGMRISIPDGFEGPRIHVTQSVKVVGFLKRYPGENRGTVLQITTYNFGQEVLGIPEEARQDATDKVLGQFVSGGALAPQSFKVVARRHLLLDGIKASRADMEGEVKGYAVSGIMYCVIVGTRAVIFLIHDFHDVPQDNRAAALKAIEDVTFRK